MSMVKAVASKVGRIPKIILIKENRKPNKTGSNDRACFTIVRTVVGADDDESVGVQPLADSYDTVNIKAG